MFGEALLLSWNKMKGNYALGKVDVSKMKQMEEMALNAGIAIAEFRNPQMKYPGKDSLRKIIIL